MAFSLLYWVNYTHDKVKLQRKSEAAVAGGRVLRFVYDAEFRVVQSNIQASMKDKSYKVMVSLDDSYGIKSSSCECALGHSQCHHVATSLLYGYKNMSKTDVKCSWIARPKSAPPKATKTIEEMFPPSKPNYRALDRPVDQQDRTFMFNELTKLGRYTAIHWILSDEPRKGYNPHLSVEKLIISEGYVTAENPREWLKLKMWIEMDQIKETAKVTQGQRLNPLWSIGRKLRITASNFGIVLQAIGKGRVLKSVMKRLFSAYNLERVAPIIWGITHEKEALDAYRKYGATVSETGLWLHCSGVLGASPDGLVERPPSLEPHYQTTEALSLPPNIVEVKCPYAAREGTVMDALKSTKNFFLGERDGNLYLKEDHQYFHQVQGQIYITGSQCADFIVWTPKDCQVIRIAKDAAWEENLTKMVDFYYTKYLDLLDN